MQPNKKFRKLEFRAPSRAENGFNNVSHQPQGNGEQHRKPAAAPAAAAADADDGVASPLPGLFDPVLAIANMRWTRPLPAGPGLFNQGNTCFLNSTLQCLLHTPAFTQILLKEPVAALQGLERRDGEENRQKAILQLYQRCVLRRRAFVAHVGRVPATTLTSLPSCSSPGRLVMDIWAPTVPCKSLSPRSMVATIRRVGRQFKNGRQEVRVAPPTTRPSCPHPSRVSRARRTRTSTCGSCWTACTRRSSRPAA